jgi:hypothetical protein
VCRETPGLLQDWLHGVSSNRQSGCAGLLGSFAAETRNELVAFELCAAKLQAFCRIGCTVFPAIGNPAAPDCLGVSRRIRAMSLLRSGCVPRNSRPSCRTGCTVFPAAGNWQSGCAGLLGSFAADSRNEFVAFKLVAAKLQALLQDRPHGVSGGRQLGAVNEV